MFGNNSKSQGNVPKGVNPQFTSFGQNTQGSYNPTSLNSGGLKLDSKVNHKKGKAGGGWDSDEDNSSELQKKNGNTFIPTSNEVAAPPKSTGFSFVHKDKANKYNNGNQNSDFEVFPIDEIYLQKHEYENKVVNDTIQPGGARIKQSDTVINDFCKVAENLQCTDLGSLLFSKLSSDLVWISKARILYSIEALVKKIPKYLDYFKHNIVLLKSYEFGLENENNAKQLKTILDNICNFIEHPQGIAKPIANNTTTTANLIDFGEAIQDNQKVAAKKFDPFDAFPNKSSTQANKPVTMSDGGSPNTSPLQATIQTQPQLQQQSQPKTNTNSLFDKLNTKSANVANVSTTPQVTQTKPKGNAFGFVGKSQTTTTQTTQNGSNTNDLLGMNFGADSGANTKPANILNMYGQQTVPTHPQDANLLNMNFGGPNPNSIPVTTNPSPYGYGYPYPPPHGYSMPPQGFYPPPMGYTPAYPPNYNYNQPTLPPKDENISYDKFAKDVQNGVALISLSEEQKKQEQANKQKKDDMDKLFDFIKL
jgi:hypothetical protein